MANYEGSKFGNYNILRKLGSGGFADVYLGQHQFLEKRQGAIKILRTHLEGASNEKFLEEANKLEALSAHPNIVDILEFGIEVGIPYLVMKYAPDGSLRTKHPDHIPLPLPTILSYVQQIASALQYAHDKDMVHRDVKPENILLGQHDKVLLSDFGIATITSTVLRKMQDVIGDVRYMAPEQIKGDPHRASDQYSLAVVVYEWICGSLPFVGDTWIAFANQHLTVLPPPLHEKLPAIPVEVEQVILKALSKDYRERFESVQAFATVLEEACALPNESYYPESVAQAIRQYYYQSSGMMQHLGTPKPVNQTDVQKKSPRGTEGYKRPFEHGAIYWTKENEALHVWWGFAQIHDEYQGVEGRLGFPLTPELPATFRSQVTHGVFQRFEGEWDYPEDVNTTPVPHCGATLYYCDQYGPFPTFGGIGICYEQLGGISGHLGFPTSYELDTEQSYHGTKGYFQRFESGIVYWSWKTEAHPVWGEIGELYKKFGGVTGRLGFPLSHEIFARSPQGTKGVYQRFEGGRYDATPVGDEWIHNGVSVYWSKHGTFPVLGGLGVCYEQLGNVSSFLGFPISLEEELKDKSSFGAEGWFQRFEGGAIFWCEAYGGVAVASSFLALHEELGGIKGQLGFPKFLAKSGDRYTDLQLQEFEGGVIYLAYDTHAKRWDDMYEVVEVIHRLYERILGRRADESGLITYGSQLHRGERSIREIVKTLGRSEEYQKRLTDPEKTVEDKVRMCFERFLGQKANESDLKTYIQLAQSQGFEIVINKLVDSEEYKNKFGEDQVPG